MASLALVLILGLVLAHLPGDALDPGYKTPGQPRGLVKDEPRETGGELPPKEGIAVDKRTWKLPQARRCHDQYCCMRECAGDYYPFIIGVYHRGEARDRGRRGCWCYWLKF